jgi:hypothetical protein
MKRIFIFCILCFSSTLMAAYKYNYHSHKYENVPSDWVLRHNYHANRWSYQPRTAKLTYNYFEHVWEWDSGHNP